MKLTKSVVECLPAPALGYAIHWDGALKGFGVRVTARGIKTFVLQRRVNGKERRITIGRLGPLTAEQARREATKLLGAVATGRDPVAERKQAALEAVTLGEAFAEYLSARRELRPKTVKDYQRLLRSALHVPQHATHLPRSRMWRAARPCPPRTATAPCSRQSGSGTRPCWGSCHEWPSGPR